MGWSTWNFGGGAEFLAASRCKAELAVDHFGNHYSLARWFLITQESRLYAIFGQMSKAVGVVTSLRLFSNRPSLLVPTDYSGTPLLV